MKYNICIDNNSVPHCTLNFYNHNAEKGYRKYPRIPEPIFPCKEALFKLRYLSHILKRDSPSEISKLKL
jgi:hypothetical protein